MSNALSPAASLRNPPVDLAVAAWLGTPAETIARGLEEGWIRGPQAPDFAVSSASHVPAPPLPGEEAPEPEAKEGSIDRSRVFALLQRLDANADATTFESAWNEAGADDATRVQAFARFFARALNVPDHDGAIAPFAAIEDAASTASGTARFVRLASYVGSELERLAGADGGIRRALADHASWALTGDQELTRRGDPEGHDERHDANTGEVLLSDAWIGDRARHAAWRQAAAEGQSLARTGDGWRFIDRAVDDHALVELAGADPDVVHQVIFARDDGERINGGATSDRIHGGAGDDLLRGRAGADLLEGGDGGDMLHGGSGNDDLAGQRGTDELDGGAGNDRLDGGSGDDELIGGRGDDLLRGGGGIDAYRFEAGDGADTVDDDGGILYFDDEEVAGTMRRDGDAWISDDRRYRLTLDGDVATGGTLAIRLAGDDGAAAGHAVNVIGWKPGSFGISLSAPDEAITDESNDEGPAVGDDTTVATTDNEGGGDESAGDGSAGDESVVDESVGNFEAIEAAADVADALARLSPSLPLGAPLLVDMAGFATAIDAWSIPSPPEAAIVADHDMMWPTMADVADALAANVVGDADESTSPLSTFDPPWSWPNTLSRSGDGVPSPPEALLRHSAH